jgi:translation initiation factor 2 alpha subunit (eIF-2alpha)
MSMDTKDTLDETYNDISEFAALKMAAGRSPFEVAAALVAIGASIYRTTLNEADYNLMMDAISTNREAVQKLAQVEAHTLQ